MAFGDEDDLHALRDGEPRCARVGGCARGQQRLHVRYGSLAQHGDGRDGFERASEGASERSGSEEEERAKGYSCEHQAQVPVPGMNDSACPWQCPASGRVPVRCGSFRHAIGTRGARSHALRPNLGEYSRALGLAILRRWVRNCGSLSARIICARCDDGRTTVRRLHYRYVAACSKRPGHPP